MVLLAWPLSAHTATANQQALHQVSETKQQSQAKQNSLKALRESQAQSSQTTAQKSKTSQGWYTATKQWIWQKQAEISRTLGNYLEQFKATNDISFAAALIGASLLYGLVHAAGPGHGKIVVSSYVMANNQTLRRGIFLAFLSSFVQGTVAVALVGSLAFIFNATGSTIKEVSFQFTQMSYALICGLGLYLLYAAVKRRWQRMATNSPHSHSHNANHNEQACGCGHSHIPTSKEVQGKWDLAKVISLVLSVGLRPCTGALYVLAFALIKGLFWVGALAVYAMALGTAMTISLMTAAVVSGRQMALLTSAGNNRTLAILSDIFSFGGALVILALGLFLLTASQGAVRPF